MLGAEAHLLNPRRVASYQLPPLATAQVLGTPVTYAVQGPRGRPLILYFHGWGDDYSNVFPLEYPLIDAGYRLLVFHRPGYRGTGLGSRVGGRSSDWRSAAGQASLAKALLDHLHVGSNWRVHLLGTSGGAPAALAFAASYPRQSRGMIIQAGVSHPFRDARYVPSLLQGDYTAAFNKFGWAGDSVATVVFGLMAKLREGSLKDEDRISALVGSRLEEAKADPAYVSIVSTMLRGHRENARGELNDARSIFFASSDYCRWTDIRVPTLLLHDSADPFVPIVHAEEAARLISRAQLQRLQLGGHMVWTGHEARNMHLSRLDLLRVTATQ